ncbi:MAG TPA: translation initiation factor IF-2 [Oceanospirillales bacterium]|jgi:translation initiation factor IF-2|uniref:translation initiation factor IF-2 n=1 Tax=unclassified Thalassolituus TaxID=2624967 RepID=UPI000C0D560A|nr:MULTISPECIES: translation initiation factor IF-2 [unclassified Thalassolituus]MAE34028.1 translation initiation factor IF-2 [Oceanospirillaceae bacterium]HCG77799.1 translation initiation factor IF-2 [Oceanospirillales bacterium]MBN56967.1 translation initiation factor IF-2 [Oceanospirillaceae bacterium]MDQ4422919.1 translation initiation factor IF-2 [Thalassolituus sp.]MDQ4427047.1 translation initiation factor IF-2 [Thalassolituus sp.]|tara:strand:- start:9209 stop:11755 length:2547 start_codon:yes stop_codon:yes gene_type:complete
MADVTVKELADVVGTSTDRLLSQMKEAGLPQSSEADTVNDEQKQSLLAFLKKSHGEANAEPKKITLKRKVTTTLKTGQGGKKAVNIEVRKKRTYVKREEVDVAAEKARQEEEARIAAEKEAALKAQAEAEKAAAEAAAPAKAEPVAAPSETKPVESAAEAKAAPAEAKEPAKKKADAKPALTPEEEAAQKRAEAEAAQQRDEQQRKKNKTPERKRTDKDSRFDNEDNRGGRNQRRPKAKLKTKGRSSNRNANNEHAFTKPTAPVVREVELPETITVGDLASKMAVKAGEVIKELMKMGVMATINQPLDQDTASLVVEEMGHKVSKLIADNQLEQDVTEGVSYDGDETTRAPVVTVMGHVDHGKTSLLDYIRSSRVASGEAGGITQHIGAYHVETDHGMVSFLDTPGHAAFTSMRARGAQATDVVILVVAADDGVMPQTEEAVQHAKSAGVPLVVAVNKMDKEGVDPDRVKNELSARDVIPEDWGGDVPFIPVSAKTGMGIEALLEAVILQAELLELKAHFEGPGQGVVVESRLDKGRGPVATLLVQNGTLKKGDVVLAGTCYGRARALLDENGKPTESAGPSIPVEILGLNGTPDAGDNFMVVENEKKAREVAEFRETKLKEQHQQRQQAAKLDALFAGMAEGEVAALNVVVKTDVRGSLEAIVSSLQKLATDEVKVNVVASGVGGITETDATLAVAAGAVLFGFNVRADNAAKKVVEGNDVDMRYYSVIYDLIDDVKQAMAGLLAPELREEIVGIAEVRDVFKSPKFGQIAGCMVTEGTIYRNKKIRVLRENVVIYEGELESLRRFKDDVQEVRQSTECGIGVKNYQDVRPGDQIEVFDVKEVARTL